MRYSTQIKPISYVKAHAAELLDRITEEREPIIITQNGEARAVLVDVHTYEESQETWHFCKSSRSARNRSKQAKPVRSQKSLMKCVRARPPGNHRQEKSETAGRLRPMPEPRNEPFGANDRRGRTRPRRNLQLDS